MNGEEKSVMRKTAIVALLALVVSMTRCSGGSTPADFRNEDDRPPIIVTNGSMNFDDGDPNGDKSKWKDWKRSNGSSNAKQWTQDAPRGFDVASYTVTIAGSSNNDCNGTTQSVSAVAIEYTLANGNAKSLVVVQSVRGSANKREPWVTAPIDMSDSKPNGKPPLLTYNPDSGYISYVTLTRPSTPVSCPFSSNSRPTITIQPVK